MIKGESGSGKTTLLNIISGIEPASHGTITISGYDMSTMKRKERNEFYRRAIGIIFQGFYLQPELSVRENIALSGIFDNMQKREMDSRVATIAKNLKIDDILKAKPSQISGGQAERVCVARACFMNPKIILADEPTNNLDPKNAEIVVSLLKNYSKSVGATVIVASHDKLVEKFATKVVELKDGKISEAKK